MTKTMTNRVPDEPGTGLDADGFDSPLARSADLSAAVADGIADGRDGRPHRFPSRFRSAYSNAHRLGRQLAAAEQSATGKGTL